MVTKLTHDHGVVLDSQLHDDLQGVMNKMTDEINSTYPQDSFRRIFWEQQLKALKVSDPRQVRWHPAIIKWCLHLMYKSSGAYHSLRSTGVLQLPSERTLRDYSHSIKAATGFQHEVNK